MAVGIVTIASGRTGQDAECQRGCQQSARLLNFWPMRMFIGGEFAVWLTMPALAALESFRISKRGSRNAG